MEDNPDFNQKNSTAQALPDKLTNSTTKNIFAQFIMTKPGEEGPHKRGISVLMKKNLGLEFTKVEEINYNLVRINLEHTIMKMTIYGVYGHSDGARHDFFLDLRRHTLEGENEEILIMGDLNTTLDPEKDRWQYRTDNHKKCRTTG